MTGIRRALWRSARYDACLFFFHLVLEKELKALVVGKTRRFAPRSHDLLKLAELAGIKLDETQVDDLGQINYFCVAGRYPEDRQELYALATRNFTRKYYDFTKEFRKWLRKTLHSWRSKERRSGICVL